MGNFSLKTLRMGLSLKCKDFSKYFLGLNLEKVDDCAWLREINGSNKKRNKLKVCTEGEEENTKLIRDRCVV